MCETVGFVDLNLEVPTKVLPGGYEALYEVCFASFPCRRFKKAEGPFGDGSRSILEFRAEEVPVEVAENMARAFLGCWAPGVKGRMVVSREPGVPVPGEPVVVNARTLAFPTDDFLKIAVVPLVRGALAGVGTVFAME